MQYSLVFPRLRKALLTKLMFMLFIQTAQLPTATAHYTDIGRMVDQSKSRITALKFRPYFDPIVERPEDPPIFNAIRRNDCSSVQKLIDSGVDLNIVNDQQFTPLNVAILLGRAEIAKTLIAEEAHVNYSNEPMKVKYLPLWAREGFGQTQPKSTIPRCSESGKSKNIRS